MEVDMALDRTAVRVVSQAEHPRPRPPRPRSPRTAARWHHVADTGKLERAAENRAYLHVLLLEKEPGFLAALELAINLVDRELAGDRRETPAAAECRSRLDLLVRQAV
jgi:hypothetical protein